jgi:putative endonuclease
LQREGMTVVARNYRTPSGSGEIDLVAWERDTLVFVEVKCRATADFGPPDRALDEEKFHKLLRAARDYTRRAEVSWDNVRFDAVTVVLNSPPVVTRHRNVFSAKELTGSQR